MSNPFAGAVSQVRSNGPSFARVGGVGGGVNLDALHAQLAADWEWAQQENYRQAGIEVPATAAEQALQQLAATLGPEALAGLLQQAGADPTLFNLHAATAPPVDERPYSEQIEELRRSVGPTSDGSVRSDRFPGPNPHEAELRQLHSQLETLSAVVFKTADKEQWRQRNIRSLQEKIAALEAAQAEGLYRQAQESSPQSAVSSQAREMEGTEGTEGLKPSDRSDLPEEPPVLAAEPPELPVPPEEPPPPSEGVVVEGAALNIPVEQVLAAVPREHCPACGGGTELTMDATGQLALTCTSCDYEQPLSAEVVVQLGEGEEPSPPPVIDAEGLTAEPGQEFFREPEPGGAEGSDRSDLTNPLPEEGKSAMRSTMRSLPKRAGEQGYKPESLPLAGDGDSTAPTSPRPSDKQRYETPPPAPGKGELPEASMEGVKTQPADRTPDQALSLSPPPSGAGTAFGAGPSDPASPLEPPPGSFPAGLPAAKTSPLKYEVHLSGTPDGDLTWEIRQGPAPRLRLSAKRAYGTLLDQPYTDMRGEPDPEGRTHRQLFQSAEYGQELLHLAQAGQWDLLRQHGGQLLKQAQDNPVTSTEENPAPETIPAEEEPGEMAPPDELGEMLGEEEQEKLLVTDILIDTLAPLVVVDAYTLKEILEELKATFGDEELTAEFSGALEEKIDSLKEEVSEEGKEGEEREEEHGEGEFSPPHGQRHPEELPPEAALAEGLEASPSVRSQSLPPRAAARIKELEAQLAQERQHTAAARQEAAAAKSSAELLGQVKVAHKFVKTMQERGVLPGAAALAARNGSDHTAAAAAEKEFVKAAVERLIRVGNSPQGFDDLIMLLDEWIPGGRHGSTPPPVLPDVGLKVALAAVPEHQPIPNPSLPPRPAGPLDRLDEGIWSRSPGVLALQEREKTNSKD